MGKWGSWPHNDPWIPRDRLTSFLHIVFNVNDTVANVNVYISHSQMCWNRALVTGLALVLVQMLCLEGVPISIDKTKVKEPEKTPEEPPASVVRRYKMYTHLCVWLKPDHKAHFISCSLVSQSWQVHSTSLCHAVLGRGIYILIQWINCYMTTTHIFLVITASQIYY